MDKPKLLIVDNQEEFRMILAETLQGNFRICQAGNGKEAIALLEDFRPDVLVLDLFLPELDGISLLQWVQEHQLSPGVLVLTRFWNEYMERSIGRMKVDYVMYKPCSLRAVTERVKDILRKEQGRKQIEAASRAAVTGFLLELGVPAQLDGYDYLQKAIPIYASNPSQALTKELYCAVGENCRASAIQVERSIRTATKSAWARRDESVWRQYFPAEGARAHRCPTNGEFISRLAGYLTLKVMEKTEE